MPRSKTQLTPAQKREYELLKKHGSVGIWSNQRRIVLNNLVRKGLAIKDGAYNWFHIANDNERKI
jgi:hypothetical protein